MRAGIVLLSSLLLLPPLPALAGDGDKPPATRPERPDRPADEEDDAGALAALEDEATHPGKVRKPAPDHRGSCDCDGGDGFAVFLVDVTWGITRGVGAGLLYGGYGSLARVAEVERMTPDGELIYLPPRRGIGDALLPFLALEGFSQPGHDGISATGGRLEAGFGPLAGEMRFTRYSEEGFPATLDLIQIHGLYRMSFGSAVEVDLGFGTASLDGEAHHAGFSMTYPVKVYPVRNLGVEFRPSWAWLGGSTLGDHSLTVAGTAGFVSLRAGYRWTHAGSVNLDGPMLGATVHF